MAWFNNESLILDGDHVQPIRVYLQAPYHQGNLTRDQRNHNKDMSEVRPTVELLFGEIKTSKFVDFTSQLKIDLRSVERIFLVYEILKNDKTCLYGNKAHDVFETNSVNVIFCYFPEMKIYGTLNKHTGFQQRYKMIHK